MNNHLLENVAGSVWLVNEILKALETSANEVLQIQKTPAEERVQKQHQQVWHLNTEVYKKENKLKNEESKQMMHWSYFLKFNKKKIFNIIKSIQIQKMVETDKNENPNIKMHCCNDSEKLLTYFVKHFIKDRFFDVFY
ncbi:predicted protein [Uncinocarpus reesii 1704]|uniref:Uncharacterized protein n=1 Tax=Uncinocarpus reesii (strain UAMH 1704) TaxID=336963 RepID=C4JSC2_UNCRE|nr:uncharacterized protein UREG_05361 [Uncinocarpus reesii 1704]EEP80519.1 predicted protein [Uncinocarpus reesii 1704]